MSDLQTDTMTTLQNDTATTTRQIGRCKWFSKGYGFIQGLGDDTRDFFVHHTQLGRLDTSQETDAHEFRYLLRGETVEFSVKDKPRTHAEQDTDPTMNEGATNRVMACNVTGIYGGPLMYQTELQEQEEQNARYAARNGNQTTNTDQEGDFMAVNHRRHGGGRGKGKGRYGGKGRPTNYRWPNGDGVVGGYYGQQSPMHHPQMDYYGYYSQAPPMPGYGQQQQHPPHQGFGMHHAVDQASPVQHTNPVPSTMTYNNRFTALEE